MPINVNKICCNCLYLQSEHKEIRWNPGDVEYFCPTGDGGYYAVVMFVPFKSNLEYLERMQQEKEWKNEALRR